MPRRDTHATVVLVRGDAEVARWPLTAKGRLDLGVVEALARIQLAAKRHGWSIRLRDASVELSELIDLVGLGEVVPGVGASGREASGQPECREQVGVEEVVVPDDPVA